MVGELETARGAHCARSCITTHRREVATPRPTERAPPTLRLALPSLSTRCALSHSRVQRFSDCLSDVTLEEGNITCTYLFGILVLFRYTGNVFVHLSCTWVLIYCVFVFGTRGKPEWDSWFDSTNWPIKQILIVVLDLVLILILILILTNHWNPNQATTKTFSSFCCPNNF